MICEKELSKARENFELAAKEFDFEFESPHLLKDGLSVFGYIKNYGSPNGAVIDLISPPDFSQNTDVIKWCKENDCFFSFLNIQPLLDEYDSSYFEEMLNDWGKFE